MSIGAIFKRFVKVILPPVFSFWSFAVFIKFIPVFHYVNAAVSAGDDSVYGLISYYKIFAPFQIGIAILTQWLIVMPIWDKIIQKPTRAAVIFLIIVLICLLGAFGIGYTIWDKTTSIKRLTDTCLFMAAVQLFYWIMNFLMLTIIDWKTLKPKKTITNTDTEPEK